MMLVLSSVTRESFYQSIVKFDWDLESKNFIASDHISEKILRNVGLGSGMINIKLDVFEEALFLR